ncbi:MAG: hypothetical protein HUK03_04520 [Bacteroidaceae bacterium]|nr:hypothetical protein [Bacteroidaceae bacterium]
MIVKRGFHRIKREDGSLVDGPVVVETDEAGCMLAWHRMEHEEPATVWTGGTYEINAEEKE